MLTPDQAGSREAAWLPVHSAVSRTPWPQSCLKNQPHLHLPVLGGSSPLARFCLTLLVLGGGVAWQATFFSRRGLEE